MSTNKKPVPKGKKEQIEEIKKGQEALPQQLNPLQQLVIAVNNQAQMLNAQEIEIKKLNAMLEISDKDRALLWKQFEFLEKKLKE